MSIEILVLLEQRKNWGRHPIMEVYVMSRKDNRRKGARIGIG